jgi:YegS/Rv2252/BmrU family lipid kinase
VSASPVPRATRALVISNPGARGGGRRDDFRAAIGVLAQAGWTVSWREAAGPAAAQLAHEAALAGFDVVVAAGGDGTVSAVAGGLVDTPCALAILPAGTGNVMAAQLGLVGVPTPLHRPDPEGAAKRLVAGAVRRVDTGLVRPTGAPVRHFVMGAGVGLEAAVTEAIEGESKALKKVLGPAAFGALGLRALFTSSASASVVRCDARRHKAPLLMAVVSNIRLYGGTIQLSPHARLDDGCLDVGLFFGEGTREAVAHLGSVLAGGRGRPMLQEQAASIRIVTAAPMPVQADGEPCGTTPVAFDVRPSSLNLLVPKGAPQVLFLPAAR